MCIHLEIKYFSYCYKHQIIWWRNKYIICIWDISHFYYSKNYALEFPKNLSSLEMGPVDNVSHRM
jgi:hypothetical protein